MTTVVGLRMRGYGYWIWVRFKGCGTRFRVTDMGLGLYGYGDWVRVLGFRV